MGITVAVAGASGAIGGELLRLIDRHPLLELGPLAAGSRAGVPIGEVHPHLSGLSGRRFEPTDPHRLGAADIVLLALPFGESGRLAPSLPPSVRIIDLGNDFRLRDAATWVEFFECVHAGTWCYGLPELPGRREQIAATSRVASPGCYATAAILALAPLVRAGLAEPSDVVVTAASGTSTTGLSGRRGVKAGAAGDGRRDLLDALRAYKVGGEHGTIPEIEQELAGMAGTAAIVSFTPMLASMPRGIMATCSIPLTTGAGPVSTEDLRDVLATAYRDSPFVRLLPEGRWPTTSAVAGTNTALLQVAADRRAGRAVVLSTIDNLGKGGAGQAVQSANLMLGLPEAAGLTT